jgi:hypothetical protein
MTGTSVVMERTIGETWVAGFCWSADISLSVAIAAADTISAPQSTSPVQTSAERSSEKNFVASPSIAYAVPAPTAMSVAGEWPTRASAYGTAAMTAMTEIATASPAPVACSGSRAGAAQASSASPAVTTPMATTSRRPTGSCSIHAPNPSRKTRLRARVGSTRVSGIRSSAPT